MVSDEEFKTAMRRFAEANRKTVEVICGGDGALVAEWREHATGKNSKCLMPVRNYGMCEKHKDLYMSVFNDEDAVRFKQFLFPVIEGSFLQTPDKLAKMTALSELTVVGDDPTSALRFNVEVNGKAVVENVIANGAVFASKLGSTGYFKSIARTLFLHGIGIAFICPTYSIPNIVVDNADRISFKLLRKSAVTVTADKMSMKINAEAGWTFDVVDACFNVAVLGYDHFMCPDCRRNRNSTVVNDNYCIV